MQKKISKIRHQSCHIFNKLSQCDKFSLKLMRLRLELLNEDLAERFGALPTLYSYIFALWMTLLIKVFSKAFGFRVSK